MSIRTRGFLPFVAGLAIILLGLASIDAQARTTVSATRLGIHPDGVTRFVMDVSDQFDFTVTAHTDPMRLVINTSGMAWPTDAASAKPTGSVSRLRYEENKDGGRIVLLLGEPALVKSAFVLAPREGMGWRFVMDMKEATRAAFAAEAKAKGKPDAEIAKPPPAASNPAPKPQQQQTPPQREAIVLRSPAVESVVAETRAMAAPTPAPAAAPAPAPAPKPAVQPVPAARVIKGGAVMSAAMPPPPERPQSSAIAIPVATAPVPLPEPPPAVPPAIPVVAPPTVAPPAVTTVAAALPVPQPEPKAAKRDDRQVVVIDPGHGGVDPGAIGVSGVYEKNITLAVARDLRNLLEKTGRYTVHLTRDRDVFIRLRDRVAIARQHGADLFISLHADAVKNQGIRGLSVYTLSQTSSDSEAQALADKENKADLIAGIDLSHESLDVANILIDLAQRETMNRSAGLAGEIVTHVGRETPLLSNTHRFAGFAVLKAPDVPSVLIELGYLSHPDEERQLRQTAYRAKLANAISRAVDGYFREGQKAKHP